MAFISQASITDTIAFFVILAIVVLSSYVIIEKLMKTLVSLLESVNPAMLTVEISSLMTLSGSSPNEINITYIIPEHSVNISSEEKKLIVENQILKRYTKTTYSSVFATNFKNFEFKNVNVLFILKRGPDSYEFSAEKK